MNEISISFRLLFDLVNLPTRKLLDVIGKRGGVDMQSESNE